MARFQQFTLDDGNPIRLRLANIISWGPVHDELSPTIKTVVTITGWADALGIQEDFNFVSDVMRESND